MTGWDLRRPPVIDEEIARWTLHRPPELQTLRAAVRQAVLRRVMVTVDVADLVERLMIVATELAGNALRHGRLPTVVALLRADGHLIVDVRDQDPGTVPAVDRQRPRGAGGLGLPLASQLAQRVGWYPTRTGKHVWAQFAITEAGDAE
jgi:serine/threonine-protein kinase RsbW